MRLLLVRHAKAIERDEFGGADFDRPLTDRGIEQFQALASRLAKRKLEIERIVSSPSRRAFDTARILAKCFEIPRSRIAEEPRLAPDASVTAELLLEVAESRFVNVVAIVGHEPWLSRCTTALIGGGRVRLAKGAIAAISFDDRLELGAGTLDWLVTPKSR